MAIQLLAGDLKYEVEALDHPAKSGITLTVFAVFTAIIEAGLVSDHNEEFGAAVPGLALAREITPSMCLILV